MHVVKIRFYFFLSEYRIDFIKGTQRYHVELEQLLADFLHVESSIVFGMVCLIHLKQDEKK